MWGEDNESIHLLSRKKRLGLWLPRCWYAERLSFRIRVRYVLSFMIFLGLCNVFALRINLSVAIVEMTAENPRHGQR